MRNVDRDKTGDERALEWIKIIEKDQRQEGEVVENSILFTNIC